MSSPRRLGRRGHFPSFVEVILSDHHVLFEEALGAWQISRDLVVREIDNIPADRLAFRPSPASRSIAELVVHIVDAGRAFAGEIVRPDGDFSRAAPSDLYREYGANVPPTAGKEELLELLRASMLEIDSRLREAGADFMLRPIVGIFGTQVTRFAVLHFAVEHESYHRGQIALVARELGLVPALTQMLGGSA